GHPLPRLGEGLRADAPRVPAARVVLGLVAPRSLGLFQERVEAGGGEALVVLEGLQRQAKQGGEGLPGVGGGGGGGGEEGDEVQGGGGEAQAAQPRRLQEELGRENMGEELVVPPPQFVGNAAALRIGEHGESSPRNSLVTQGITTEEGSLVYPSLLPLGLPS